MRARLMTLMTIGLIALGTGGALATLGPVGVHGGGSAAFQQYRPPSFHQYRPPCKRGYAYSHSLGGDRCRHVVKRPSPHSPTVAREAIAASYQEKVHIYGCHQRRKWTDCAVSAPLKGTAKGMTVEMTLSWTERVWLIGDRFHFKEVD
jgi:hypothetical protein